MADNVTLDPGTGGADIATDDAGAGGHVQIIKLAISADGSATVIPADATNGLLVDVSQVQGTVTVDGSGVTQPVSGTVTVGSITAGDNNIGNVDVASSVLPSGAATSAKQDTVIGHLDGVEGLLTTIDADTGSLAATVSGSEQQVDVVAALPAGDNNIGNVDIASAIPAGTNNIGDVDVASIAAGTNGIGNVGIIPRTSGGLSVIDNVDIDETEDAIKATAGQLFGWYLYNDGASEVYVKIYDATVANVTVGTTDPVMTLPIPAGAGANVLSAMGIAFANAITVAATTGPTTADTGAPAANQVVGTFFYA